MVSFDFKMLSWAQGCTDIQTPVRKLRSSGQERAKSSSINTITTCQKEADEMNVSSWITTTTVILLAVAVCVTSAYIVPDPTKPSHLVCIL